MVEKKKVKKESDTMLIRVDAPVWQRVKEYVESTRQSIGGFFSLAADEKLQTELQKDKK